MSAKDAVLTIRLSEAELAAAKSAAASAGLSLSNLVRQSLAGSVDVLAPKTPAAFCDRCGHAIKDDNYRTIVYHVKSWESLRRIQKVRYAHDSCLVVAS